jgi:hypothetical protein
VDITKPNFNVVYRHIIENSLFTERQLYIISKRLGGTPPIENISSGAYYRQVKQCQNKVVRVLYTMILLMHIGAIDSRTPFTIERLLEQLNVILNSETAHTLENTGVESVIYVIKQLLKNMTNV